jgi:hypothetical protein
LRAVTAGGGQGGARRERQQAASGPAREHFHRNVSMNEGPIRLIGTPAEPVERGHLMNVD